MEHRFDLFTKAMAQEMPRRGALKRIGAGLAAAFVAASGAAETVLAKPGGNADCAHWCHDNFQGSAAGHCTSDAAHGQGACYQCGPAAPAGGTAILCNGACVPSDVKNCGACGNVCTAPANATPVCANGQCGFTCNAGFTRCGNACVNEQTDPNNCGACGRACPSGVCANGVCQPSHVGGHCTTNTDCTNASLCVGGICQPEPPGKPCQTGQDCDTDICTGGVCQASPLGGVCVANGDCTSGACSPNHVCICPSGQTQCGNACVPNTTTTNCGTCGNTCTAPANAVPTCVNGTCGFTCNTGYRPCNGACIPQDACCDINDCAAKTGAECINGTCQCGSGMVDCGIACLHMCSTDPAYYLDRFQSCLQGGFSCRYCTGWMSCIGTIDTGTACGTVTATCCGTTNTLC